MSGRVLGAVFVVSWSSGFVGAILADGVAGPVPLLAWRYLVTAILLLLVAMPTWPRLTRVEWGQQMVLGLCAHAVFLGAVFRAAACGVDAGTSALVCALQPMLVAMIAHVGGTERMGAGQWGGLVLGVAAVVLAVGDVTAAGGAALVLPFVALAGLSASALLEQRWRPRLDILHSLAIQVTVSAIVFTAVALVSRDIGVEVDARFVGAMLWLVLLSGLGGYASYVACLRRLGPTQTSALLYLTPAITGLWAWVMFGQALSASQVGGLGLAAAAVLLVSRRSHHSSTIQ